MLLDFGADNIDGKREKAGFFQELVKFETKSWVSVVKIEIMLLE